MRRRRLLLATLLVLACAFALWRGFRLHAGAPNHAALQSAAWAEGTRVLARDGRLLAHRPSAEGLRGQYTRLDDVSPRLVAATLASEDHRFYSHDGVDRRAIVRAFLQNLRRGRVVSGGSTITQQLVKRIDYQGHPRPRTLREKLYETARAQNLEARMDKRGILEAYLNRLDYGRGIAGPEAASERYFGVHAAALSLAQAALLAVLPRAPSALDPYRHEARAVLRQRALLEAMYKAEVITREDCDRALAERLVFRDRRAPRPLVAPHLALTQVAPSAAHGEVATTLDLDLQKDLEALVRTHMVRLHEHGARNAAVVVVDNATGDILAEVGSADYFDKASSGAVDLARSRRQAGSTLKPFVYARAFETGVSPMQMLADVPTEFGGERSSYAPENFDGTFVGPVSAREALAGSLNIPAVSLARTVGAKNVVETLTRVGLVLPGGAERYGLSIALGSAEVSPVELAEAYVTLARGGEHVRLRQRAGDPPARPMRVFDAAAVASVADALSDPIARIRGLRTRGPFEFAYPVALKTGTSTAFRDGWTCGYTQARTAIVWVGNADASPTNKLTGAVSAGPLFLDVMNRATQGLPHAPLFHASLLEPAEVCPLSGLRATAACTDRVRRMFATGMTPHDTCTVHRMATPTTDHSWRCDEGGADRIVVLPEAFARWFRERPPEIDPHGLPWLLGSRVPGCAASSSEARIIVLSPRDGSVFSGTGVADLEVEVLTEGLSPREPLEVLVDGRVASRLAASNRGHVPIERGDHLLEVRPVDGRLAARLGRASLSVR